jgi:hypothetical protein
MFVPLVGLADEDCGDEGVIACESKKPNKTMNGNARMNSTISRLRVLMVMLVAGLAKNLAASMIQMLTKPVEFP